MIRARPNTSRYIPLITTIVGVCLLLGLGTWQVYRLQWKTNLIETFHRRLSQPPQEMKHRVSFESNIPDFTPATVTGFFLNNVSLKLQGRSHNGQIGYHLIMALMMSNGCVVLVDRGWIPLTQPIPVTNHLTVTLRGYIRHNSDRNFMTPANDYNKREIYFLDLLEVAKNLKLKNTAPFYLVETGAAVDGVYPVPAQSVLHLRNNHLQYAIIWYTLAIALIVIYIVFHRQRTEAIFRK